MIITDLDGTLLNDQAEISKSNRETLIWLGENKIIRVAATGRSLFLVHKVLDNDFPIDYVIFSSGAGIFDWKKKRLLRSYELSVLQVKQISEIIKQECSNLMIFDLVPENHKFHYWLNNDVESDFIRRLNNFQLVSKKINGDFRFIKASQIMTILPEKVDVFNSLSEILYKKVKDIKVIRASSPIDGKSIWCEIFPQTVSKGKAVEWLCKNLDIPINQTASIGNDYNDLDMLNITKKAFVVENSPLELLQNPKFKIVKSNNEDGFQQAMFLLYC